MPRHSQEDAYLFRELNISIQRVRADSRVNWNIQVHIERQVLVHGPTQVRLKRELKSSGVRDAEVAVNHASKSVNIFATKLVASGVENIRKKRQNHTALAKADRWPNGKVYIRSGSVAVSVFVERKIRNHASVYHPAFFESVDGLKTYEGVEGSRPQLQVRVARNNDAKPSTFVMVDVRGTGYSIDLSRGDAQPKDASDLQLLLGDKEVLERESDVSESFKHFVSVMLVTLLGSDFVADVGEIKT